MTDSSDLQLAELMAARLCHDLGGPIGAVSNGVELMGDGVSANDPEVVALIAQSARQAAQRLQFLRVAFGSGNALPEGSVLAEARRIAIALFDGGRTPVDWPSPNAAAEAAATRLSAKLILNLTTVAAESLPRGGTVLVDIAGSPDRRLSIKVTAQGGGARVPDEIARALADGVALSDLTAKAIPGYLVKQLAARIGGKVDVKPEAADRLAFIVEVPAAA